MRHTWAPGIRWALVGYAGTLFLFTAFLFLVHAPESLLILTSIPVVLAATRYPRWVCLVLTGLMTAAALWAIAVLSTDHAESLTALAVLLATVVCLTELIRWLTLRRIGLQQELRWQARLLAETPNPPQLDQALRRWLGHPPAESHAAVEVGPAIPVDAIGQECGADTLDESQVAELLEATGADDDRAAFNELIDAFLVVAAERIAAIRSAIACDDAEALFRATHSLTGSSGSYGARPLSALARQIETIGRHGSVQGAGELLEQLEAEFERVQCAFAMLRQGEEVL